MSEVNDNSEHGLNEMRDYSRPSSNTRNVTIFGILVVLGIFVGLGIWSATAPLARAVSASATLSVKGERKKIQHFEGGIVASLHVTEGKLVEADQLINN